jgi:hypothetical protein
MLIGVWRGVGKRENRSGKQQRVSKIVDLLNFDVRAGVGHHWGRTSPGSDIEEIRMGPRMKMNKTRSTIEVPR